VAERSFPRRYEFDPPAEAEYLDALRYYQLEGGIGATFEQAVRRGVDFILQHPEASPVVTHEGARKRVLGRFPYNLYSTIEADLIVIRAVAHQKRRPGYWTTRL
jgi:plasmid stabilization system protein ParE